MEIEEKDNPQKSVKKLSRMWLIKVPAVFFAIILGYFLIGRFGKMSPPSFKMWMAISVCGILFIAWAVDIFREKTWAKVAGVIITAIIGAMAVASIHVENRFKVRGLTEVKAIHAWNHYHYVLGTKYFNELGYFDLYKATLLADREFKSSKIIGKRIRDMHTYSTISRKEGLKRAKKEKIKQKFSKKRWRRFKADLKTILRYQPSSKWGQTIQDLGYNPSPAWLIIHKPLLNSIGITKKKMLHKLASIQIYLFAITFLVAWWGFGMRTTLVMTIWINLYFGNAGRLPGGYFPYDWFCVMVWAAALAKKEYLIASAGLLSYSAMMRGFPGLMAIPFALKWAMGLFHLKKNEITIGQGKFGWVKNIGIKMPMIKYTKFSAALILFCLLVVVLGGFSSDHGFSAWGEWKEKIGKHSQFHVLAAIRVGMRMIFTHDYGKDSWIAKRGERKANLQKNNVLFRGLQALIILMALAAMIRRNDYDGMVIGLIIAFSVMVLSRYYFTGWVLLFTFSAMDKKRIGNLVFSIWMFALIAIYFYLITHGAHTRKLWITFNIGLTLYFFALLSYFLIKDALWLWGKKRKPGHEFYNELENPPAMLPNKDKIDNEPQNI